MMHWMTGVGVSVLLLAAPAGPGAVSSKPHGFTVVFPGAPKATSANTPDGTTVDRWTWDDDADAIYYHVDVSPVPDPKLTESAALDMVVSHIRQNGKWRDDAPIELDGVAGHEVFGTMGGAFFTGRYFVHERKMYQVYGGVEVRPADNAETVKRRTARVTEFIRTFHFVH